MKTCKTCAQEFPDEEFEAGVCRKTGYVRTRTDCRACLNIARRARPKRLDSNKRWSKYCINEAQFLVLLKSQDHKCAICGYPITSSSDLDHDHTTYKIRAILCGGCNRGIGQMKDDPVRVQRAADYLKKHNANPIPRK